MTTTDPLRKECEELLEVLGDYYPLDMSCVDAIEAFALRMKQEALREAADALPMTFDYDHTESWLRARAEEVSR